MAVSKRTVEGVLADIKEHPSSHRHSFEALHRCCMVDGALDMLLMSAHESVGLGWNGGQPCDVTDGPCSCGAFH